MATEPLQGELVTQGPLLEEDLASTAGPVSSGKFKTVGNRSERLANAAFIGPAVVVVLCFSIFPLIVSPYISLSRMSFVQGGIDLKFIGFDNYTKLINGSQKTHLLGLSGDVPPLGWLLLALAAGLLGWGLLRYARASYF